MKNIKFILEVNYSTRFVEKKRDTCLPRISSRLIRDYAVSIVYFYASASLRTTSAAVVYSLLRVSAKIAMKLIAQGSI